MAKKDFQKRRNTSLFWFDEIIQILSGYTKSWIEQLTIYTYTYGVNIIFYIAINTEHRNHERKRNDIGTYRMWQKDIWYKQWNWKRKREKEKSHTRHTKDYDLQQEHGKNEATKIQNGIDLIILFAFVSYLLSAMYG